MFVLERIYQPGAGGGGDIRVLPGTCQSPEKESVSSPLGIDSPVRWPPALPAETGQLGRETAEAQRLRGMVGRAGPLEQVRASRCLHDHS